MTHPAHHEPAPTPAADEPRRGHGLLMVACCIPMLVIAVALVATGAVSAGFLLVAIGCTAIMALMMRGMHGDGEEHSHSAARR